MRAIRHTAVLTAALAFALPAHSTSYAMSFGLDIFFAHGSAQMSGEQLGKLEELRCKAADHHVEALIAVAHATSDEPDAQALSELRALAIKAWVKQHTDWSIYTEAKGASQPVADKRWAGGQAKNRRVEMELIGSLLQPGPGRQRQATRNCQPAWKEQLLASASTAPTVAATLVEQGILLPQTPFLAALDQGRSDIFDALWQRSGIHLSPDEREEVALKAWQKKRPDLFMQWVARDGKAASLAHGDALLSSICASDASTPERVAALDALREAGARVGSTATMQCVLQPKAAVEVLDVLLRAGGQAYLDADLLVASGSQPALLERLLALGMDPRVVDSRGATLFHTMRLDSPATVQRLLDWGLDINAKAVVPNRYGRSQSQPVSPMYLAQGRGGCGCGTEVLEYMKAHGARVAEAGPFDSHTSNTSSQRWLVENGIPVTADDIANLAHNESNLPIFAAMQARGIDLNASRSDGRSPLGLAIEGYQVELVRFLVQSARVDLGPQRNRKGDNLPSAFALAQSLPALEYPAVPIHGAAPDPMPEPWHSPQRQARKEAIIAIIEAATTRP